MNSEINKKNKVLLLLLFLLLTVIGYIIYDKIINQKKLSNDNELIEKIMEENSDYEYIDISYFDEAKYGKEISDYKYVEDEYEYSFSCLDDSGIQINVKNGKLVYKIEEQEYESKMFNNVKKASVTVAGGTCGFQKIIVLTTDGNLYESISVYKMTPNGFIIDNFAGKNNKEILDIIDKSFKQIKLTAFNVNDFKFTRYIYGDPVLVAINLDNNKTLIKCEANEDYCTRTANQGILDYVRTFGEEIPTVINKDGSICINECDQHGKVRYNNDILKIQSIFMISEGNDVSNYFDYAIDRKGYLYQIKLISNDGVSNIYKASESPVKKIGYKKLNNDDISLIFICEDGTVVTSTTQGHSMYDVNSKIGN